MILTEIPSILTVKTKVNLFKSIPCTIKLCTLDQTNKLLRTFILVENGVEDLNLIENPIAASFFDVGETGTLDIFVTSKTNTGEKRIDILLNNFFNDAFFLKSLVTNTASLKPYGVNYNGGTLKFSVTDTNGIRRPRVISQLPQTSYMALNTPYTLIGLGRTNNYIDDLFVGTSLNQTDHFAHFTGVIPNSQLIIIPKGDVDSWRVEMIVNPSKWILGVLGFLGGMLLFLGLVVWFFQRREDWEDEEERKRDAHLFNFEAL